MFINLKKNFFSTMSNAIIKPDFCPKINKSKIEKITSLY